MIPHIILLDDNVLVMVDLFNNLNFTNEEHKVVRISTMGYLQSATDQV